MRSIVFEGKIWGQYETLRLQDKQIHQNLCRILTEMQRHNPAKGLGKPEQLKFSLSGFWSRRISKGDRVVYRFDDKSIYIFAIGGHYHKM